MGIFQRGSTYYVSKKINGIWIRVSLHTEDRRLAESLYGEWNRDIMTAKLRGGDVPMPIQYRTPHYRIPSAYSFASPPLSKAASEFLKQGKLNSVSEAHLKHRADMMKMLSGMEWEQLTASNVDDIQASLKQKHAPHSAYKLVCQLRGFLKFCVKRGYYDSNEFARISFMKEPPIAKRKSVISEARLKEILAYFRKAGDLDMVFYLSLLLPLRLSSRRASSLKPEHFNSVLPHRDTVLPASCFARCTAHPVPRSPYMKTLLPLIAIFFFTVCAQPKQQAVGAMEAIAPKQEPIENLLFEAGTPPANLPFIKDEEISNLRTPIEDMAINHRLVRVQDNFAYLLSKFDQFSDDSWGPDIQKNFINEAGNLDIRIQEYFAIYLDPQTMDYYQALPFPLSDDIAQTIDIPQLRPAEISNRDRMVHITNPEPSLRVYADTAGGNKLWGQKVFKIPDLYKGWTSYEKYLYTDPENKIKVVFTPITNGEGFVCYKATHPVTKQIFYAARAYQNYQGIERELAYNLYPLGSLSWFTDTPDEIWQEDGESFYK